MPIKRRFASVFSVLTTVDRASHKVSVPFLMLCLSSALCSGQQQLPPLVPLSQTSGRQQNSATTPVESMSVGALTDAPIVPGETVHVLVFDAPDLSIVTQVSDGGDVAVPMIGAVHLAGLDSEKAEEAIVGRLEALHLVTHAHVIVTVNTQAMGITVLGEVHDPGVYQPAGKLLLSDLLAMAGGMTGNAGRVVEISNPAAPGKVIALPWDPTMHNIKNYDVEVHPGARVFVRPCGIAYVGGNVAKAGAYSLCGSPVITLSEIVAMAGGVNRFTKESHTYIIRAQRDGSRVAILVNIGRIERGKGADPLIREDDIVYLSPSPLKTALAQAEAWAVTVAGPLIYVYH